MANTLTISAARNLVRVFARNAGDASFYPTYMLDLALFRAANELIRGAHLALRTDAQATVADQASYTVTPTIFRCDRLDSVFLTGTNVQVRMGQQYPVLREWLYARGAPLDSYGDRFKTARLAIVDYTDLNDYAIACPTTGQPVMIGFQNDGTYNLWPTPDQVYNVNRRWSDLFTTWTFGIPTVSFTNTAGVLSAVVVTDGSDTQGALAVTFSDTGGGTGATGTATVTNGALASVAITAGGTGYTSATQLLLNGFNANNQTFNLPDDLLYEVLSLGAPAFLQFNDPEHAYATEKGAEFKAYIKSVAGIIGGLGVKKIIRRG